MEEEFDELIARHLKDKPDWYKEEWANESDETIVARLENYIVAGGVQYANVLKWHFEYRQQARSAPPHSMIHRGEDLGGFVYDPAYEYMDTTIVPAAIDTGSSWSQ